MKMAKTVMKTKTKKQVFAEKIARIMKTMLVLFITVFLITVFLLSVRILTTFV